MRNQIKFGRYHGIELGLHISWVIIAFLLTLSLNGHFHAQNPDWTNRTVWITSLITGLLFFLAIFIHELSHSLVAQSHGIPVRAITLFAFGGVAQIEKESSNAKVEFQIGIVGPMTSVAIGFLCLALARFMGWDRFITPSQPGLALLVWLGYINISLALFNLIPGFPLDGGRILRALLWWLTGSELRATRIAARIGRLVAFGFIFYGIWKFFFGWGLNGLWLAFIGFFLKDAAHEASSRMEWASVLKGVKVGDMMSRDCPAVPADIDLESFVQNYLLRMARRCYVVSGHEQNVGIITPHEVKNYERSLWPLTTVGQAMRPLKDLHAVSAETSSQEALLIMSHENVNQLPVVTDGHINGLLSRSDFLQLIQSKTDLDG